MGKPQKCNWEEAKGLYATGWIDETTGERYFPTVKQVAERYGVSPNNAHAHSSAEKWREARTEYKALLEKERFKAVVDEVISASAEFDSTCLGLAGSGINLVKRHLRVFERYSELVGSATTGDELEDLINEMKHLVDPIDLDRLARALERFQKVGRLAQGQSTENVDKTLREGEQLVGAIKRYQSVFTEIEDSLKDGKVA